MKKSTRYIILIAIVAVLVGLFIWYKSAPGPHDKLADCLKAQGTKMYGAFWCPHCQAEKALFGKSAEKLPYVECSESDEQTQTPICIAEKINSYPTWDFANPITLPASKSDTTFACKAPYTSDQPQSCENVAAGSWVVTTNALLFLTPSKPVLANNTWTLPAHTRTSGTVPLATLGSLASCPTN